MAFQITLKSQFNQDLAHAVARIDGGHHKRLKSYMHCRDEIGICFPGNVKLLSRGRGWYRLECMGHNHNAEQRLQFAMKIIRRFLIDDEKRINEELKLMAPMMKDPGLRVASFSNAHSEGEYGYIGRSTKTEQSYPQVASAHRLQALARKFNNKRV